MDKGFQSVNKGIFMLPKLPNRWIIEKAREFQNDICFSFIDYAKAFDCVDYHKLWKILKFKRWKYQTTLSASCKTCMQVKKQQLEPDRIMDWLQLGKEYIQAVYCHPAYLTYMHSTS